MGVEGCLGVLNWPPHCSQLLSPSQPGVTELLGTDDRMDQGQEPRPEVAKGSQDELGMVYEDTSGSGREYQLLAGDG